MKIPGKRIARTNMVASERLLYNKPAAKMVLIPWPPADMTANRWMTRTWHGRHTYTDRWWTRVCKSPSVAAGWRLAARHLTSKLKWKSILRVAQTDGITCCGEPWREDITSHSHWGVCQLLNKFTTLIHTGKSGPLTVLCDKKWVNSVHEIFILDRHIRKEVDDFVRNARNSY